MVRVKQISDNGVHYPDTRCDSSPTGAHHYKVLEGEIWVCKYCYTPLWAPTLWTDAMKYGSNISRWGLDGAYSHEVSSRPLVKQRLSTLEQAKEQLTITG